MTKGERLIWDLFMMVREVMPPTAENTKRQHEWAQVFHEMEHASSPGEVQQAPPEPEQVHQAAADRDADEPPEDQEPDQGPFDEDPHEHGVPNRGGAGARRGKGKRR